MTSTHRGHKMMQTPMSQLPPLAVAFARHLCKQIGMCGDVFFTAWCAYAEIVEGLPCDDPCYAATPDAVRFFREHLESLPEPEIMEKNQ